MSNENGNGKVTREDVLRKAQSLQAMIDHPNSNENEVANATAILRRMMDKYQLQEHDLKRESVTDKLVEMVHRPTQILNMWQRKLMAAVANGMDCEVFVRTYVGERENEFVLVGMDSDVEVVKYLYDVLASLLWGMGRRASREYSLAVTGQAKANKGFIIDYVNGASNAIHFRLKAEKDARRAEQEEAIRQAAEGDSGCTALVVLKEDAIARYMEQHYSNIKTKNRRVRRPNQYALRKGYEAGQEVPLTRGIPNKGKSVMQLN